MTSIASNHLCSKLDCFNVIKIEMEMLCFTHTEVNSTKQISGPVVLNDFVFATHKASIFSAIHENGALIFFMFCQISCIFKSVHKKPELRRTLW